MKSTTICGNRTFEIAAFFATFGKRETPYTAMFVGGGLRTTTYDSHATKILTLDPYRCDRSRNCQQRRQTGDPRYVIPRDVTLGFPRLRELRTPNYPSTYTLIASANQLSRLPEIIDDRLRSTLNGRRHIYARRRNGQSAIGVTPAIRSSS